MRKKVFMRCYFCSKLSLDIICKNCQKNLLVPTVKTRTVGTLDVISFFRYSTLETLLHTKHKPAGYRVFKKLGILFFKPFIKEFVENEVGDVYIIGIDEVVRNGYSHVALLTHAMQYREAKPMHTSLLARSRVNYSGKSLQYRLENPRNFVYTGQKGIDVILVDDIITTGITLQEAQNVLMEHDVNVLFALTLADVEEFE
jgi:competence protein ComFC